MEPEKSMSRSKPDPLPHWNEAERWVYTQTLEGQVADFHARLGLLDVSSEEGWSTDREIRAELFETLLTREPFRQTIGRLGVRIVGAWVRETLSLENARLGHALRLERSRVEGAFRLSRLKSSEVLSFEGTTFAAYFSLSSARIDGPVRFAGVTFEEDVRLDGFETATDLFLSRVVCRGVNLSRAKIAGNVDLLRLTCSAGLSMFEARIGGRIDGVDVSIAEDLDLNRTTVAGVMNFGGIECAGTLHLEGLAAASDLFLGASSWRSSKICEIRLLGSDVKGQLSLMGAHCEGDCNFEGLSVGAGLYLRSERPFNTELASLDLSDVRVHGNADMDNISCTGLLKMPGLRVALDLFLRESELAEVDFTSAKVDGDLMMFKTRCSVLEMLDITVGKDLLMPEAKFRTVGLYGAHVGGKLDLADAKIDGEVDCRRLEVGSAMLMMRSVFRKNLDLARSAVGDYVDLTDAWVNGALDMSYARVDGNLRLARTTASDSGRNSVRGPSTFGRIDLTHARVGRKLILTSGRFTADLKMDNINVGSDVLMDEGAEFTAVSLRDGVVSGTVAVNRATFNGPVNLDYLRADYLWIRNNTLVRRNVSMLSGEIGHDADLSGATFEGSVSFRNARVAGSLVLESDPENPTCWGAQSSFDLRNAEVGGLQDGPQGQLEGCVPWPARMKLNGFVSKRFGGDQHDAFETWATGNRPEWYLDWLSRNQPFSMQPYRRLARALSDQGRFDMAEAVMYGGMEAYRREARGVRRLGLEMAKFTIGYGIGYRYFWSLAWALLLTLVGCWAFFGHTARPFADHWDAALFSLDQVLPVIKIYPGSDEIAKTIIGWRHTYLVAHRALGFLLGSFVLAGLAGLTKKE